MAWELVGNIKGPQGEKGDAGDDATVVVDAALSGESENPVQNKVIKEALDGKAASEHAHKVSDISDFPESMPASDVSDWAKQPAKPTYTAAEVGAAASEHAHDASDITSGAFGADRLASGIPVSKFTNDLEYQTATQVSSSIDAKISSVYKYKGSVANQAALPSSENVVGDVYNCEDSGMNYAWNGTAWDALGSVTTLSDLGVTATAAELNYVDGVTSSIQTQLDEKAESDHIHSDASASKSGFMSLLDKQKLDGIEEGANKFELPIDYESNQVLSINSGELYWRDEKDIDRPTGDKFGGIKLGDTDGRENTFYLDAAGNLGMKVTAPLKFTSLGSLYLGYGGGLTRNEEYQTLVVENPVPSGGDDGQYLKMGASGMEWDFISAATTSENGLMSSADKTKLDGLGLMATSGRDGLMSSEDKTKLDGIAEGADALPTGGTVGQVLTKTADGQAWQDVDIPDAVTVDTALDAESENPIQNKAVKAALDEKADISDPTFTGDVIVQGESMSDGKLRLLSNGKQLDIGVALGGMASISLRDQDAIDSDIVVYFSETGLTMTKPLSVSSGGTGGNTASAARTALGITPTNIGAAAEEHSHAASDITSGELSASRLPTVPIAKGGTGATTAEAARTALEITPTNIGAAAANHTHADYQTEAQVEAIVNEKLGSVYKYKGSVANFEALPVVDNVEGDVYNCEDTGMNYAWDGTIWDALGAASTLSDLGVTATAEELNYLDGVTSNIQTQIDGKASSTHTHTVSQISDFPASMPASDVSAWAKAETKPTYTAAEVGAAEDDHVHTVSQITDFPESMPASDVYSWAKAAQKPAYTYTEVGAAASTHTHSTATTSVSGFMSAADKAKLDGIAEGADALPTGGTAGQFLAKTEDGMIWQDVNIPTVSVASDEDFKAYMGIS